MDTNQQQEILNRLTHISEQIQESEDDRKAEKIDYIVALLLGIATIFGALAAYYSAIWGGNSAAGYNKANFDLSKNNKDYLEALSDYNTMQLDALKDDIMYVSWGEAIEKNNLGDAEYYKSRMSEKYAALLGDNAGSEAELDSAVADYDRTNEEEYTRLWTVIDSSMIGMDGAKALQLESDKQNGWGDAFTFVTVLFTVTLFFGGMSAVSKSLKLKMIYFGMSIVALAYSLYSMFVIPFP